MEQKELKIKDYIILKKIGKGAYGTVYKVKWEKDSQIFALKYLNISKMD